MPRDNVLGVWLHGSRIAELERVRGGQLRLRFDEDALEQFGSGTHLISLSMPLTTKRVQGEQLNLFVRGLLPEDQVRAMIERESAVPFNDDFALLRAIGGECAGALQFLADDTSPSAGILRSLSADETNTIVRNLPTLEGPDALPIGASLGGIQAKVLLTQTSTGWAWPAFGAASTHIIKPEPVSDIVIPNLIDGELWAGHLAAAVGLRAAVSEIHDFDGRRALVISRYDRVRGERVHQEDFTQALSLRPIEKYEQSEVRPGRLEQIVREAGPLAADEDQFRQDLLRAITFNAIIGNSDAHSKNYSLLISGTGSFTLAPLYDAAPVMLMNRNFQLAGHALDGQTRLAYVTRDHLVREAARWGMAEPDAMTVVVDLATRLEERVTQVAVADELAWMPELVASRANEFLGGTVMRHIRQ